MSNEYRPDNWVVIRISKENKTIDKILSGWAGSYLYGESWRLSSGVTKILDKDDHFEIHNQSGSVYLCSKNRYGFNITSQGILSSWEKSANERDDIDLKLLSIEEVEQWTE